MKITDKQRLDWIQKIEDLQAENQRLRERVEAATAYIKGLEEHGDTGAIAA